jgi:hypothetical protein
MHVRVRNAFAILFGKSEETKLLARPRWKDKIKMDLRKTECESVG